jgi:hypothetical protein
MFYEDFPSIPLILDITLQDNKTLFCVLLSFRNLPELKLTWDFWSINIYHERHLEIKKSMKRGPGAKRYQLAWALAWLCHPRSFEPGTSDVVHLCIQMLSLT